MQAIEEEINKNIKQILKLSFSSMAHLCTKMMPVRPTRPFSSVWNEHSYWSVPHFMEQNVWQKFESAIKGPQVLVRAKAESNKYFSEVRIAPSLKKFLDGKYDIFIYTGSCLDLILRKFITRN